MEVKTKGGTFLNKICVPALVTPPPPPINQNYPFFDDAPNMNNLLAQTNKGEDVQTILYLQTETIEYGY